MGIEPNLIHHNLVAAWIGILLGFLSGLVMGLFFTRETWLGGYGSFKRRLYRLAHISLFGLGGVNLFFYVTALEFPGSPAVRLASWSFIIGAVSMPVCCVLLAHFPRTHALFAVPVVSLLVGAIVTLSLLMNTPTRQAPAPRPESRISDQSSLDGEGNRLVVTILKT